MIIVIPRRLDGSGRNSDSNTSGAGRDYPALGSSRLLSLPLESAVKYVIGAGELSTGSLNDVSEFQYQFLTNCGELHPVASIGVRN